MQIFKLLASLGAIALAIFGTARANLIYNGDFELGNVGFGSDYGYSTEVPLEGGLYNIVANANDAHQAWLSLGPKNGTQFFVANGSPDIELSPWFQTIDTVLNPIATGVDYRFQAYIASVYPDNPPQLAFEMSLNESGIWQTLTTSATPAEPGVWYWLFDVSSG